MTTASPSHAQTTPRPRKTPLLTPRAPARLAAGVGVLLLASTLTSCFSTSREDMVAQSRSLSLSVQSYDAVATQTVPQSDPISAEAANDLDAALGDFDDAVDAWLDESDSWDLGPEPEEGLPSRAALVHFNDALDQWRDLQPWYVEQVVACVGESSVEVCLGDDPKYLDWKQAYEALTATAAALNSSSTGDSTPPEPLQDSVTDTPPQPATTAPPAPAPTKKHRSSLQYMEGGVMLPGPQEPLPPAGPNG